MERVSDTTSAICLKSVVVFLETNPVNVTNSSWCVYSYLSIHSLYDRTLQSIVAQAH